MIRTKTTNPHARVFTVVRNPYDVCVSAFYHHIQETAPPTAAKLNAWVQDKIKRQQQQTRSERSATSSDDSVLLSPQHRFIFDENDGSPLVDEILRYENLDVEFRQLMKNNRMFVRLQRKWKSEQHQSYTLTAMDFTRETIVLVNNYFAGDFEQFGYERLDIF